MATSVSYALEDCAVFDECDNCIGTPDASLAEASLTEHHPTGNLVWAVQDPDSGEWSACSDQEIAFGEGYPSFARRMHKVYVVDEGAL